MSRPYFETKVVKVKKERPKHKYFTTQKIDGKMYGFYYNKKYKMDIHIEEIKKKSKGNWVNGENLDKIKFPRFCKYNGTSYGLITRTKANEYYNTVFYTLHGLDKQHSSFSSIRSYVNFRDLIEVWDIHILKGKIIIFEEEKENDN